MGQNRSKQILVKTLYVQSVKHEKKKLYYLNKNVNFWTKLNRRFYALKKYSLSDFQPIWRVILQANFLIYHPLKFKHNRSWLIYSNWSKLPLLIVTIMYTEWSYSTSQKMDIHDEWKGEGPSKAREFKFDRINFILHGVNS